MPVEVNIIIDLKSLIYPNIPQRVEVSRFTFVRFLVRAYREQSNSTLAPLQLRVELYFENTLPGFKPTNEVTILDMQERKGSSLSANFTDYIVAANTVTEEGIYKYGVRGESGGIQMFDEDPYLIVY